MDGMNMNPNRTDMFGSTDQTYSGVDMADGPSQGAAIFKTEMELSEGQSRLNFDMGPISPYAVEDISVMVSLNYKVLLSTDYDFAVNGERLDLHLDRQPEPGDALMVTCFAGGPIREDVYSKLPDGKIMPEPIEGLEG